MNPIVQLVQQGQALSESQSEQLCTEILSGAVEESEIEAALTTLKDRGETVDEIVGFARAMRNASVKTSLPGAIDTCGTGGSGKDRFNVSTASAFVLSAAGVRVAKHGNKGSKQANGSFDFLEALGLPIALSPEGEEALFNATGLAWLFARTHHPAMKYVGPVRAKIGSRTIFNCLGPLCNPANTQFQVIGTISLDLAEKMASAAQRLGTQRTIIVIGSGGIDELSPYGVSTCIDVSSTNTERWDLQPADFGLNIDEESIVGGLSAENARLFERLVTTKDTTHPISQYIALNSGLALMCIGHAESVESGYLEALNVIKSGAVAEKLNQVRDYSSTLVE